MSGRLGKPCAVARCAEVVTGEGQFCKKHQSEEQQKKAGYKRDWSRRTEKVPLYNTERWKEVSLLKRLRNPKCEVCQKRPATAVHHIKRARDYPELQLDIDNLQSICDQCHGKETVQEQADDRRKAGTSMGIGEYPVDE